MKVAYKNELVINNLHDIHLNLKLFIDNKMLISFVIFLFEKKIINNP